jgi:hypothetical protein
MNNSTPRGELTVRISAMPADNDRTREPTIFSAVLTPHRSLGPAGFAAFMLVLGGLSFATGTAFLLAGAWPVFGFVGLDVLLVYSAFQVSYRRARAYEMVTVTPSELMVRFEGVAGELAQFDCSDQPEYRPGPCGGGAPAGQAVAGGVDAHLLVDPVLVVGMRRGQAEVYGHNQEPAGRERQAERFIRLPVLRRPGAAVNVQQHGEGPLPLRPIHPRQPSGVAVAPVLHVRNCNLEPRLRVVLRPSFRHVPSSTGAGYPSPH